MTLTDATVTVVLLPGLDGSGELMQTFADRAPTGLRAQVVSYPPDVVQDYDELVRVVRAQLPEAPHILVGESYSGPLAVMLATQGGPNLRGVVLAASFVTPPAWSGWRFLPWRTAFRFPAPAMLVRRLMAPRSPVQAALMREAILRVGHRVLAARVRQTLRVDVRRELAMLRCPLLYIEALRDQVVAKRCLRQIREVCPAVAVAEIDVAHPVLKLAPDEAWVAIENFVSSTAATPPR